MMMRISKRLNFTIVQFECSCMVLASFILQVALLHLTWVPPPAVRAYCMMITPKKPSITRITNLQMPSMIGKNVTNVIGGVHSSSFVMQETRFLLPDKMPRKQKNKRQILTLSGRLETWTTFSPRYAIIIIVLMILLCSKLPLIICFLSSRNKVWPRYM
jgi:hypothetical protein